MDDPAQHATIIYPGLAAHVGWKQRLDPGPLRIGKLKEIAHNHRLLNEAVNHGPIGMGIHLLGPDPSVVELGAFASLEPAVR